MRELNLSDNEIVSMPNDMSKLRVLASLNVNGNNFDNVRISMS